MNSLINIGIIITYIFATLAIAAILFFALKALVVNFKEQAVSLIGAGVIALVFVVAYLISSSKDVSMSFFEKTETNPALSKLIGSGMIMLYMMIAAVFVAIIYAQVTKIFKK
jgi:hypothetical protein